MANLIPWKRLDKDAHYYNLADRLKNRYFDVDVITILCLLYRNKN